ncbi:MAG: sigma-70 family RNA polymerase sigma factor [Pseudomonadales bacterium]|nr:sigma-70 family RNA polymerase sigma factor [Pseudomonadales bacterium]
MLSNLKIATPIQNARDRKLVKKMLVGDERAFKAFVDEYFPKLYRYAYQRLQDQRQVEDVVQEVLTKAARRIETYRGEAALLTWLIQICRHEISQYLHNAERHRDLMAPFLNDDVLRAVVESIETVAEDNPEACCRREELISMIQLVLDQLPERYASALEMKYIEGASSQEIASHFNMGDVAVQSLLARARSAFRELCCSAAFAIFDKDETRDTP